MPRPAKEGAVKRTYRLSKELLAELERIATAEDRTVTAQIERFLGEKVQEYSASKQRTARA